ncbi:hypothetical protein TVAG_311840 [Trichomonas vaginalis G3]|uniref:Uncharacterized protein n=2 Tax=Trichomonas vaginalis (strain ATCC PRA-98 / G3) TaxID=412133 RepID=A2EJZ0_TRIV3|nr:hypothetical protein TVAG_311840 [Trichomonas vaginalis G3]|eukprot:XP_001319281.1 hypothetical protein [Trichomonas vaginalis G3]
MIVPHKESGVTACTYFVLNDLTMSLKGSSLTLPFSSVWNEQETFQTVSQTDNIVIDTPFSSFSFDKSLILIFTSTDTLFHIWNSLPGQPCEISAIVYSSKNVLMQVLPQNNFTYNFQNEPGYIIISVNSKSTLYHAYTQQNITDVTDFPFRCNDFVLTSELSSSLKFGHSNSQFNYTFKKAWSTCIFYSRIGKHKLTVTNPFTRQIKVDLYYYPNMSVCDETQEYFNGPLFVHLKVLIPPNAGSIDITDTCLTNCSDLYPKTLTRMINPFAEGGDAISVHELVANMSTRRQIIILGVLFFMLVIVLLIAIATCFGMIFFYGITFSSSDYMQGNKDDFVDDCRYPRVNKNKVPQAIEPAAFQPVMPASYYLSAPL